MLLFVSLFVVTRKIVGNKQQEVDNCSKKKRFFIRIEFGCRYMLALSDALLSFKFRVHKFDVYVENLRGAWCVQNLMPLSLVLLSSLFIFVGIFNKIQFLLNAEQITISSRKSTIHSLFHVTFFCKYQTT